MLISLIFSNSCFTLFTSSCVASLSTNTTMVKSLSISCVKFSTLKETTIETATIISVIAIHDIEASERLKLRKHF